MVDLDKNEYGSVNNEDTIEITLEDLEDEPQPQRVYGTVQSEKTLEITWDDLNAPDPTPTTYGSAPNYTGGSTKQSYGSVPNYANVAGFEKKGKKIEAQGVVYPLLVGLVGGFLAFLVNEPFTNDNSVGGNGIAEMGLFLGIIGALVSGALSCVDDVKSFVFEKAFKHFISGALAGFVTGFIGGIIAQIIFGLMLLGSENVLVLWIARTLGWAIAGTFVGLSQSFVDFKFNQKRLKNGLIGGVIGGAIGNLIDRISRGFVVDFIRVWIGKYEFPNFNVADSFITVGCFMMIVTMLVASRKGAKPLFNEGSLLDRFFRGKPEGGNKKTDGSGEKPENGPGWKK